jgi:hypothetical protein
MSVFTLTLSHKHINADNLEFDTCSDKYFILVTEEQINSHINALKENGLYVFRDNIFALSFIENLQFTFHPAHVHEIFRLYIK